MPIIKGLCRDRRGGCRDLHRAAVLCPHCRCSGGRRTAARCLLDLGCKKNIVRCLCKRGCRVTVLPASTTLAELKALAPDGLMLSNGPGDPAENVQVIANIRDMLDTGIASFRHLSGPPADRPGCRRQNLQNEIWPPRRQPACDRLCAGTYLYYQPEPRLCGSGRYFGPQVLAASAM